MAEPAGSNVRGFPHGGSRSPMATYVGTLKSKRVEWLSPGRIAYGKTTILDGDPGLGKSTMTLDWAAKVTRGDPLPDGEATRPRGVMILTAEDGPEDTIRPRLEVAGADLMRAIIVNMVDEQGRKDLVSIPEDLASLKHMIIDQDIALVIIDPLVAFLTATSSANSDQDMRRALSPLAQLAEDTGAAVLMVRHLNKTVGGSSIYRGGGSIGIIGAARFGLLVGRDGESKDHRLLTTVKANLGPEPPSWSWRLVGVPDTDVARVEWLGHSEETAADITDQGRTGEERESYQEAKEWLIATLQSGAMTVKEIKRLAREAGITEATLRRAKHKLGVKYQRDSFGGDYQWDLPDALLRSAPGHAAHQNVTVRGQGKPHESNESDHAAHGAHAEQGHSREEPDDPFKGGEE